MSSVFVGVSGGVDSAVSAALLQRAGHAVTGVFIKIWQPEFVECTWRRDRLDAMRVCAHLGIPFREIDLSQEYKQEVAEEMIRGYARGETPNPDIACNRSIKFGHFLRWALQNGADTVATGHYARIVLQHDSKTGGNASRLLRGIKTGGNASRLLRGIDRKKDQSYFLAQLGQHELSHALFPIGDMSKSEVRTVARKLGLPNANRPDSQGLCFVGDIDMRDFLRQFIDVHPGVVLDMKGMPIGTHEGAAVYTIGERHGFLTTSQEPHFVVATDVAKNTITVSPHRGDAERSIVPLKHVRWVGKEYAFPLVCDAQARYRGDVFSVTVDVTHERLRAHFDSPHIAARGQSLVLYRGDDCIASAVME